MTDDQLSEIHRLRSIGMGVAEISRRTGVNAGTVSVTIDPTARTRNSDRNKAAWASHKSIARVPYWQLLTDGERRAVNDLCERLFPETVCDLIGE